MLSPPAYPLDPASAPENSDVRALADIDAALAHFRTLYPKVIDLSLARIERFLEQLGNPHFSLPPVIHVAGTNGKGSTCATVRAIAEAAGHTVHMATSPHLVKITERVVVASREISGQALLTLLRECAEANGDQPITIFEIMIAASFLAFARTHADLCVLEVGMGGRLDATNVVKKPAATVITMISFDHMQHLGDTLPKIAAEKAGIMKPGVPCVIGRQTSMAVEQGVLDVFAAQAKKLQVPLYRQGQEWDVQRCDNGRLSFTIAGQNYLLPAPNLPGLHQYDNAGCALAALYAAGLLEHYSQDTLAAGITSVHWPARMQRLEQGKLKNFVPEGSELWLDGGHNDTGGAVIAGQIKIWRVQDQKPLIAVIGMLSTKKAEDFLKPFIAQAQYVFTVPVNDELSMTASDLADIAKNLGASVVKPCADVSTALTEAAAVIRNPSRILICGSLYLAGSVLAENQSS